MAFLIGLLTVIMVLDCLLLILLVLIQLPKKDAGAGLAFGGGATDALFGAGTGNVLTKITKYAATTFFALAVVLSIMQSSFHRSHTSAFERSLDKPSRPVSGAVTPGPATAPTAPAVTPATPLTNNNLLIVPAESTNTPTAPTNPATPSSAPK